MAIIEVKGLHFRYPNQEEVTLKNIDLAIEQGQWTAIVGHNGSGKSTLARILNGLQLPTDGTVHVQGVELSEESIWDIRKLVGMVFQNPDNQFVGSTVEDDVAFGLENIGIPREEMVSRVADGIQKVGMESFLTQEPHQLSGGQKQRVAIAGLIALRPSVIILDEATSMLDPLGRKEVIQTIEDLRRKEGVTVISITHDLEEAARADRIIVLNEGEVFAEGTPDEIFLLGEKLVEIGLDLPFPILLANKLKALGVEFEHTPTNRERLMDELCKLPLKN
ncbi:energy-coupling factor ABC transporter ATP-binding protein [Sutcliffiella rhizosphaerae]|uniref:Energy-coupling factor transporter ATP-binding protein EcfA1 n=1 Tax=Sutcliffiella rhizosphaerae TaxID=2880967 RepID=A0ABM8YQ97_9BACI|nr:energy-coupling factor ABC transporter ATP-binding protein [Sutcliffiella rhizosphaerae]CAG9622191.1 Energy-coupling factor transporter ATP-binding protein EcfA1 [Sutcliffiella rhizosphaerae]